MAALTADVLTDRYGSPDGHQPLNKLLNAGITVYRGSVAALYGATAAQGTLKNEATPAATDIVVGLVSKAGSGWPNTAPGIVGGTGVTVEIETGSFILASGTGADALGLTTNGATVYLIDEVTVGATNGGATRPTAGTQLACNADDASIPVGFVAVKLGTIGGP